MLVLWALLFSICLAFAQEIKVGFTAVITKEDALTVYKLLEYLSQKTGYTLKPVFAKSYDEMDFFLFTGQVDIAYICGAPFVEGTKKFRYKLLAVPFTSEGPVYYSYVITRREKNYRSIFEFKGKSYAFSDPKSNSGSVVPTYILMKKGHKPAEFFKTLIYTYSHYESIIAVYKGFVEGASVDSLVYEQTKRVAPHITSELKVVERFGPFPTTPFVYRRGLDHEVVEKVRKAMLDMNKDPEGRLILERMGITGFGVVKPSFYKPIHDMTAYIHEVFAK
ncbi:Phosphate-import protein PhnD [bacterium HR13]|nr:Phosphate-import protein PhnD [bacterium HR13]